MSNIKLKKQAIDTIISEYKLGLNINSLAAKYNCHYCTIRNLPAKYNITKKILSFNT